MGRQDRLLAWLQAHSFPLEHIRRALKAAIILTVFIWAEVRHRRQLREEARRPRAALVLGLLPETAHIGETLRFKLAPPGAFWPPVAPNAWVRVGPFLSLTDISRPVFPGLSAEAKQDVTLDPPEEVNGGSGSSGGLFSDDEEDTGADGTALRRSTRRRAAVSRRSGHSPVRTSARRKSGSAVDKNAVDSGADHANPWVVRIVHLDRWVGG